MGNFSRRFGIALNLILALVCAIWAYTAIKHLAFITAVIALGLAVTWLFVATQLAASKNAVIQAAFDESGLLSRPDRRIDATQRRSYTRPLVLIVGDFAMREHAPTQSDDLYDLVSDRAIAAKPLILTPAVRPATLTPSNSEHGELPDSCPWGIT